MLVAKFVEHNMQEAQSLFDKVKRRSPGFALKLLVDMQDYVLPRLSRTEFKPAPPTTDEPAPVTVQSVLDAWRTAPRSSPPSLPAPQPEREAISPTPVPTPASPASEAPAAQREATQPAADPPRAPNDAVLNATEGPPGNWRVLPQLPQPVPERWGVVLGESPADRLPPGAVPASQESINAALARLRR